MTTFCVVARRKKSKPSWVMRWATMCSTTSIRPCYYSSRLLYFLDWSLKRWGEKWQICGIGDIAIVPLVVLILSIFGFVMTPVFNTQTRTQEREADMYGLNASRQPDGVAQGAIHLGEYRKMRPGPIEEFIFYDHPSGYSRIHRAMQWKAENLQLFEGRPSQESATAGSGQH